MNVTIALDDEINDTEVIDLYSANNWSSANKPELLLPALRASHSLVTARISGQLVGIANAISDGYLVVYYPHLLVHPEFHRNGIGKKLMQALATQYSNFHQQILSADYGAIPFYKSVGFIKAGKTQSMWIYQGAEH